MLRSFLPFPLLVVFLFVLPAPVFAQGFFTRLEDRALRVQSEEPHWATPILTNTPVLDQSLRADFRHATLKGNSTLWNLDSGKGAKVIVASRTEVDANFPPFLLHSNRDNGSASTRDGFGDLSWALKYRFLSRTPEHGNALLTGILQASLPTGSYSNGAANATVAPTLAGGKGWGAWDVISTVGATLPVKETRTAGRQIAWNTALQYRQTAHWWYELEENASFQKGGSTDGQVSNYLTPGVISRWRNESRRGITISAGMQFATTRVHSVDHNVLLSARLHF